MFALITVTLVMTGVITFLTIIAFIEADGTEEKLVFGAQLVVFALIITTLGIVLGYKF